MKIENQNPRPVMIAVITASLLMFIFGLGYRVLAACLAAPVNTTPISPAVLARFPMQIGDWTGREVPLDEAIVRATDTDAHVNRSYSRNNGWEHVSLYVAAGVKTRDLAPHNPDTCYTGAGWTRMDKHSMKLPISDGTALPCKIMQFSRGIMTTNKIVVLDYYIVDGEYCSNVSLLRSKAWRGSGTVRYVAQVQIVTSIQSNQTVDSATKIVRAFAVDSAPLIRQLFRDAVEDQHSDNDSSDNNRPLKGTENG